MKVSVCYVLIFSLFGIFVSAFAGQHTHPEAESLELVEGLKLKAKSEAEGKACRPTEWKAPKDIPVYQINLDESPLKRWNQVAADYPYIPNEMDYVISKYVPRSVRPLIQRVSADIDNYLPQPFADELRGLAKSLNASLGDTVILNLLYDLTAHCTSIISQDAKGQIWHSRNLDYSFTPLLRNTTIHVDFMKNGKVVYSGTTFAGYIGLLTGQKPKGFTISVDERYEHSSVWENALIALLDNKAGMVSLNVRQVLAEASSFTEAVVRLADRDTIAPVYFIVGGVYPGQGAVITRNRLKAVDTWFLDPSQGRWFIVETNYDHWLPPPKSDDRRDAAIKMMNTAGQKNIDCANLFKVMVTPPVGRPKRTVYTNVMSAGQPDLYSEWLWPINSTRLLLTGHLRYQDNPLPVRVHDAPFPDRL